MTNRKNPFARFLTAPAVGPLLALIVLCIFFAAQSDRFLTGRNLSLVVQQVVGTLAIGQTLIILTRGIDLSNGLIMALGSVLMTKLAVTNGLPPLLAILLGIGVTIGFGLINGLLVTRLELPPFIVTLGTLNIAFALTRIYTTSTVVGIPEAQLFWGNTFAFLGTRITYGSVLMIVMFLVVWYALTYTPVGRHIYAIGDNPEAARLTGIPTQRIVIGVYAVAGFFLRRGGALTGGAYGRGGPAGGAGRKP